MQHYANIFVRIRLPILLVSNPFSVSLEARSVTYLLSDHCLYESTTCDVITLLSYKLMRVPPLIIFPHVTKLFMWCVAWLEQYLSDGCIQFSFSGSAIQKAVTHNLLRAVCETQYLGLFIMTPGCLCLPDEQKMLLPLAPATTDV